jgi:DNA-binding NarL/FixJ family response regulator
MNRCVFETASGACAVDADSPGGVGNRRVVPTQRARVIVTGDEPLLADGMALLLGRAGIESTHVETPSFAIRVVERTDADALTWAGIDLDAKTLDSLAALRRARPATGLCLISHRADARALERLVAQGSERLAFVLRTTGLHADDFVRVVRSVLRGYSTADPALLRRLVANLAGAEAHRLTDADHEVMELVAAGYRNAEIARRLWKSEKAIEKHVGRLFSKFGLAPELTTHLDRRVTAARIYLASHDCGRRGLLEHRPFDAFIPGGPEPPS